jgi:GAF domain-containing protein
MAEDFIIDQTLSKEEKYQLLIKQLHALIEGEPDVIANLSNVTGAIHQSFGHLWTGIYFVKSSELVLGPYQGPVACTRIALGKGVCGTAFKSKESIIVENVDEFPGHIACSSLSKSEIVVPVFSNNKVHSVLDIDSTSLAAFDNTDKSYLEEIAKLIEDKII